MTEGGADAGEAPDAAAPSRLFPFLPPRLDAWLRLIRVDRPIGTMLVLWPTLWALWIAAEGQPDAEVFLVFMAGVFLMRSAGCAINDYADRGIDGDVRRTRRRPLAAGEIPPGDALWVATVLALVAFLLVLRLDPLTIKLSLAGGALAAVYPFTKRLFHTPQLVLGIAFAWAVPMGFAASTGEVPAEAWVLFLAVTCWVAAYDTMYAMVDRDDDLRIGVKSTAVMLGRADRLVIALFMGAVLGLLALVGVQQQLGVWFAAGLGVAGLQVAYQLWLIRNRERDSCFRAFLSNDAFGRYVFIGLALDYLFA
jgi:4-hydroxybenzoate polyprenyltransferase